jgi:hypothetical protein
VKNELRAEFDQKIAEEKERLRDEFETANDKALKRDYRDEKKDYKAYRLTQDIMSDPKKDGSVGVSHKKGGVYYQNSLGNATLQFKYKIGDPDYFERVPEMDYSKVNKVFNLNFGG